MSLSRVMLTIRRHQFDRIANRQFAGRITAFLRKQFPDAAEVEPIKLEEGVLNQIGSARSFGFIEEAHVAVYVTSAWMLGETFDKDFPAAAETLGDPKLTAAAKADWLSKWTVDLFEALEQSD